VLKSLLDLVLEIDEVRHVISDLVDRELDQHTSDLGGLLVSDKTNNVLIDAATNLLLHVRVVGVQGWDELRGLSQILLTNGHLLRLLRHHAHVLVGLRRHLVLWHGLLLLHHSLVGWHVALHLHVGHVLLLTHAALVLHLLLVVHVLSHASLVVEISVVSLTLVELAVSSSVMVAHVHLLVGLLIVLDDTEKLLEHLSQVRLRGQVIPLESSGLL